MSTNSLYIDLRGFAAFCEKHIAGSYCIPLSASFDTLIDLIDETYPYTFVITQEIASDPFFKSKCLSLSKSFIVWDEDIATKFTTDMCIAIDDEEFKIDYTFDEFYLVDLRDVAEFEKDSIEHASSIPLEEINHIVVDLEPQDMYYLYADHIDAVGFAASVFKHNGIHNLRAVFPPFEILKNTLAS